MIINIPDNWLPTPDNINALPEPLRNYISGIETICNPQYLIQELILTKDLNRMLESNYVKLLESTND